MNGSRHLRLRRLAMRLLQWCLFAFVLVLAVRLAWGWEAAARLAGARHRFGGSGVAELLPARGTILPDDRNAALVLIQGIRSIKVDGFDQFSRGDGRAPFFGRGFGPGLDISRMRALVSANKDALELIDRAATLPEARWPAAAPVFRTREFTSGFGGGNFQLRWLLAPLPRLPTRGATMAKRSRIWNGFLKLPGYSMRLRI